MDDIRISKFLSLVLRHEPERIGLQLDVAGWVNIDALLTACAKHRVPLTRDQLEAIVANSDKQRFAFDDSGERIRANQGHSVAVELGYTPTTPPDVLYHGTVSKYVASIRSQGLLKGDRHHVLLSKDEATANKVGARRGQPVILRIDAGAMHHSGHSFFVSTNEVWLVDHVPPQFIEFPA